VREVTTLYAQQSTGYLEPAEPVSSLRRNEERLAAVVGGAALVALAARDRSWRSIGLAVAGAPLVWRGATGHWPVPRSLTEAEVLPPTLEVSLTIARPRDEVYAFWRNLENLPCFMRNLDAVTESGDNISHWIGKSPLGLRVEWDAEIVDDVPGHLLSWRSLPDSQVDNAGTVLFADAPGDRGTVIRVTLAFSPPGGGVGRLFGKALSPITKQQVHEDLRRFKSLLEAGEIPTTHGQPAGHRSALNLHNPL